MRELRELGGDVFALWLESLRVVWLRTQVLVEGGPGACAEAQLMVTEKLEAQGELAAGLASGRFGSSPLSLASGVTGFFLEGVRANRVRLARRRKPPRKGARKRSRLRSGATG